MLKHIRNNTHWFVGLIGMVLLSSILFFFINKTTFKRNNNNFDKINSIVVVNSESIPILIKANGTVQAIKKINISPKEAGRISQLYVNEGDKVKFGQLLVSMESEQFQYQVNQYKAAVTKAQANLAYKKAGASLEEIAEAKARILVVESRVAQAEIKLKRAVQVFNRNKYLAKEGAISQNSLEEFLSIQEEAQVNVEEQLAQKRVQNEILNRLLNGSRSEEIAQAKASVEQAVSELHYYETQLEKSFIYAPFSGTITRRFAQQGDFVTPTTSASNNYGATSTSIVELSSGLEVEAKVPESSIAPIKLMQGVVIVSDVYSGKLFKGYVRSITPRADQENNVTFFRVKVSLRTGNNELKSGMNVKLTFWAGSTHNALVVPIATVLTKNNGQTGVLVFDENNQIKFRPITLGITSRDKVQILQGVSKGERVLINIPSDVNISEIDDVE
jgi:HlyD family secretion protein